LPFDCKKYGRRVAEILAFDQDGDRLIPLVSIPRISGGCSSKEARALLSKQKALDLFPAVQAPEAALAGLWLYFSAAHECHQIVQDLASPEGSFWHGIVHRQEPDAGNASYWFRRVGSHPVFRELHCEAQDIAARYPKAGFKPAAKWDPFAFIEVCEQARLQPGSEAEAAALEIQRAEWQLLFDYCARSHS
jgi:hypothetical protein